LITEAWFQRNNGSWKNLLQDSSTVPVILPVSNIDSTRQAGIDQKLIEKSIVSGKTDAVNKKDGLYYTLIKEGTGRQVSVKDSVTIFYKGYLFSDGTVFDETKDIPRTFPLNRLIMGWQLGVSICKVGGKIMLVIPSGLGYGIRTRAVKIPPNSILVFEIEVVDAK
jgi:FKBP-type peptidyl-prolyl cis-trans isomerase